MSLINKEAIKNYALILLTTLILLVIIEGICSIIFYQKIRLPSWSASSFVHLVVSSKSLGGKYEYRLDLKTVAEPPDAKDKLHTILSIRQSDPNAYPSYLFEPQYHDPRDIKYMISNVSRATIVNCDENGFFSSWNSDEIGFRNPLGQVGSKVDYVFIGDSFTEGACEQEEGTIAGYFRANGKRVVNLGRGGSGPLFQLGTLVEYGDLFESKELVWVVFTGNDLLNLTEEKTTLLGNYLDKIYKEDLYELNGVLNSKLKTFLDNQISDNKQRFDANISYPANEGYGEALDYISSEKYEKKLLADVAQRILQVAKNQNKTLKIVILNHHDYDEQFKKITSQAIRDFADRNSVSYIEFTSDYLRLHKEFYTQAGTHFNAFGYQTVGEIILDWLTSGSSKSISK